MLMITVDVEDWPQSTLDPSLPLGDYCADNVRRIVDLMAAVPGACGTFFILGLFAEKHPDAVRAIAEAGHEIGSHGSDHLEIFHQNRQEFAEDLRRSTALIADIAGQRPVGYRAPDFSVVGETLWTLEELAEQGYAFDSSIFPMDRGRYGIEGWPRDAGFVQLDSGDTILEVPMTTIHFCGRRLPVSGGGYARLLPKPMLLWALRKAAKQLGSPPVFYCHPYEFDPDEFDRLDYIVPGKIRFHQGMGRRGFTAKFKALLRNFNCLSISQAMTQMESSTTIDYKPFVLEDYQRPPIFHNVTLKPRK